MLPVVGPLVYFMGTEMAVDFMERLSKELGERVRAGQGAIPEEKFRLYYANVIPWQKLGFFDYFRKFDAVLAHDETTDCLRRTMDPSKPLESLALKYFDFIIHASPYEKCDVSVRQCIEYRIDAAICGLNKSCKINTVREHLLAKMLREEAGIPSFLPE